MTEARQAEVREAACRPSPEFRHPRIRCCLLDQSTRPETARRVATTTPRGEDKKPSPSPGPAESDECGVCGQTPLDQRIVGGKDATLGQFPWIARLGYSRAARSEDADKALYQCGASLHDERKSPDCDDSNVCAPPTQDVRIAEWRTHPQYQANQGFSHDIAVIRLQNPVNFTRYVRPICLPSGQEGNTTGRRVLVAGWGTTEPGSPLGSPVLQMLWKSLVTREECARRYKGITEISTGQLCAGGTVGEDSCAGDSGGPLARSSSATGVDETGKTRFSLIGVVSFGSRQCGSNELPGVYTDTVQYRDWLQKAMRELGPISNRINENSEVGDKMPHGSENEEENLDRFEYDSTGYPIWDK
ncbi:hypothetical protein B566_EDAN002241 [Ephemera danica]|nr:hypothetical protein B566_EDAN002241 [Ephemera danica]